MSILAKGAISEANTIWKEYADSGDALAVHRHTQTLGLDHDEAAEFIRVLGLAKYLEIDTLAELRRQGEDATKGFDALIGDLSERVGALEVQAKEALTKFVGDQAPGATVKGAHAQITRLTDVDLPGRALQVERAKQGMANAFFAVRADDTDRKLVFAFERAVADYLNLVFPWLAGAAATIIAKPVAHAYLHSTLGKGESALTEAS